MKTIDKRMRAIFILLSFSVVFIVSAPLRRGKTLTTTEWILKRMEEYHEKKLTDPEFVGRVITNYPVHHPKLGYTDVARVYTKTKVVNPLLGFTNDKTKSICHIPVNDSLIVFDEAHRLFDSRKWQDFDDRVRDFFVWAGQNGNDVILITPHPNRIETIVRELCETFFYVKKIAIPLLDYPLMFIVEGYEIEEDFRKSEMAISREYTRFKKSVANSYNTHFFREEVSEMPDYDNWADVIGVERPTRKKTLRWALSELVSTRFFFFALKSFFKKSTYTQIPTFYKNLFKYRSWDFYVNGITQPASVQEVNDLL